MNSREPALVPEAANADASAHGLAPERNPGEKFWAEMRRSPVALFCGALLVVLYFGAIFADVLSPVTFELDDMEHPFHPPSHIHWVDASGKFIGPYVNGTEIVDLSASQFAYRELKDQVYPIRFFVEGEPYRFLGLIPTRLRLFGVEAPGKVFLIGSDQLGRDQFTRLLYGSRVSLSIGLVGVAISFCLGMLIGGISGYYLGWVDTALMRLTEILMSIPGLYLILALRAMFPVNMPSVQVYLGVVIILAFVNWASLARVVRGMVLSLRSREFVTAAQALGVGSFSIITRHILPNTYSFLIVAATVSIPAYILGEVALSFLGVGIQEPYSSWGNMLRQAQNVDYLKNYPWLMSPGVAIFAAVMAFNFLGDGLRDALDPRKVSGGKV